MELYIGGTAQGKLAYVLREKKIAEKEVQDGSRIDLEKPEGIRVLQHFELYVKRLIDAGADPMKEAEALAERNPEILIISDEIGSGVIPADAYERIWRDSTGRVLCMLAARAAHVTRIICGIGQKIK